MNAMNRLVSEKVSALQNWTANRTFGIKHLNQTVSEKLSLFGHLISVKRKFTTNVKVARATDTDSVGLADTDSVGLADKNISSSNAISAEAIMVKTPTDRDEIVSAAHSKRRTTGNTDSVGLADKNISSLNAISAGDLMVKTAADQDEFAVSVLVAHGERRTTGGTNSVDLDDMDISSLDAIAANDFMVKTPTDQDEFGVSVSVAHGKQCITGSEVVEPSEPIKVETAAGKKRTAEHAFDVVDIPSYYKRGKVNHAEGEAMDVEPEAAERLVFRRDPRGDLTPDAPFCGCKETMIRIIMGLGVGEVNSFRHCDHPFEEQWKYEQAVRVYMQTYFAVIRALDDKEHIDGCVAV